MAALAELLDQPLLIVDVGCRWGFADSWHQLGDKCRAVGFEPDAEECERLSRHYAGRPEVRVVPQALGAESGPATLYLTKDPVGHSLLPTVADVVQRHPGLGGGLVVGTSAVEVTTLDEWCGHEGVDRVDVIKIDTQGSELDVLRGADRTLAGVQAIEVEVEFNELYEDVPLFGEIDRYLRDRGFVLWRLRDLAHYAQAGMPVDWWSEEFLYYDSLMARFPSGGGQLFWANAYYLKRSVAYPAPEAGWESLVRGACVASALQFQDLVRVVVEAARPSAPPDVVATLDGVLSDEGLKPGHGLDQSMTLQHEETLTIAADDPRFSGLGWRPVQVLEYGPVRWTGPAREAWIDVPLRLPAGARVEMLVVAAMSTEILDGLVVEVNRFPLSLSRSADEHGLVFSGVVPDDYTSDRPYTRFVVRTVETIPWRELHPESWDDTELGVALSWLRISGS